MTNEKNVNFASWIVLAAINLIIFYPSFYNHAKADQIVYLIETAEIDSLPELISYSYSYCRTRVLLTGDKVLFRPIFYILLSVEKSLWGYNFVFWQLTGFFLHIVNVVLLLKLLRMILSKLPAFLLTLFFSTLYVGSDLVTWHHMHGYLLFIVFTLSAMLNFIQYIKSSQKDHKKLWLMILFLLFACFTNEFGVILSLIISAILLLHRKYILKAPLLHNSFILLFPPLSYLYVSFLDYALRFKGVPKDIGLGLQLSDLWSWFHFVKILYQSAIVFLASFILPFSPGLFIMSPKNWTTKVEKLGII